MTVEIDLIPEYVIEALEGRGLTTHDIENATPEEIFVQYTEWIGLIGHGGSLIETLDALRCATKAP